MTAGTADYVFGGYSLYGIAGDENNSNNGNTVSITGGKVNFDVYGGCGYTSSAFNNKITISGSSAQINGKIYGGFGQVDAKKNRVTISNGTIKPASSGSFQYIYGGYAETGDATGNEVILSGGTFDTDYTEVIAGNAQTNGKTATGNSVTLNGTINIAQIFGGRVGGTQTIYTNNTLNLGKNAQNNVVKYNVAGFDKIATASDFAFSKDRTVLTAGTIGGGDKVTLDIHGSSNLLGDTDISHYGTMTLLSATNGGLGSIKLNYNNTAADIKAYTSKDVKSTNITNDTASTTVRLDGTRTHTVANSGTAITYTIANNISKVTFGNVTWGTTPRTLTANQYKFGSGTTIDKTNLAFTNPEDVSGSMTLLANATGMTALDPISHTQYFTKTVNGATLSAILSGNITRSADTIGYTATGKSINSINLAAWEGTAGTPTLTGWTKKADGTSVEGAFTKPQLDPGDSIDILTANTDLFSNANIDASIKYTNAGTFDDTVNGVTLSGNRAGGVKAEDSGKKLTYYAEKFDVNTVSLGDMKWDTPREATSAYDFAGVTNINASGLTLTGTATAPDASTNLITGAKNLSGTVGITQPTNASVAAEFTDTNGVAYKGTGTGTVGVSGTDVKCTITGGTISSMNLNGWTGTQNMNLPTSWTGTNIAVETGNFASLAEDKTLFNNLGANTFGTVSGSKAYKSGERITDDTQNGVTLAGNKTGGIKTEDSGATLKYYAESMSVDAITLGEMKWGTGRNITGTGYTFNNVGNNGVDASGLTFTFTGDKVNTINVNDAEATWELLTGANGLQEGLTVKGSQVSQKVSYGIDKAATLSGTLTGTVSTLGNAVQYKLNKKTLDSVDISKWDGSTTTGAVDASWSKLDGGITVTGSGFNTPIEINDYNILTAGSDFFSDAKIDSSIAYQPSGTYSETEKNITISGKQAKGVKASSDGTALQYSVGAAYIDTIGLGKVTYNKGAVLVDKHEAMYNFSNVKTLDKSGFGVTMTDDQKKTAAANDSMTLVKANNTLNNIGAQDTGKLNYTYTANPGLTVKGAVTGNVSATGGNVLYTVSSNKASDLNVGKLGWNSTYARPNTEIAYSDAFVNAENVFFTGVSTLNKGDTMKLVSNFGDSVNKTRAGIFTLDNGKTGKGHAYWDSATKSLMYVVDRGVDEQVAPVEAVKVETTIDGENPHKGDVPGGKAEGDGEAKDNETKVKNSHIQKNDDGTGGDANGGTSENGNANKNKLNVEDSEIDGDANGGQSDTGNTEENEVIIKRGTIHGTVTGGETLGGHGGSKGNTTTLEDSTVDGDVNGGKTGGSGNTEENHVILTGSKIGGDVNGGHSGGSGGSKGNETTLDGTEVGGDVNGGKTDGGGNTEENHVILTGSKIGGDVNGGHSGGSGGSKGNETTLDGTEVGGDVNGGKTDGDGETKENKVDIKNGSKIGGNVTGGRSGGNGDSTDNETTVEGKSQVDGDVTGGQSEKGNANKNETTVTEGSKVGGDVTGGKSNGDGTSNENKTTVSGGSEIGGNVVGGHSKNGDTNQNETTVTGGSKVEKDVIGGWNEGKGTSNENKATVDGSTVGGSVVGGQSESGTSVQNTVNVTNSNVGGSVMGGYSKEGAVSTNEATVSGGSVGGSVYGGKTDGTGVAASNNVTLDGNVAVKGAVYGGYSENGTADGNIVTVKKAAIDDYVYGGKSKIRSSNDLVYFHEGTVLGIIGGGCDEALNNSVSLLKGDVTEHVIGGFATTTATGNTVTLTGGTVNGSVIGGYGGTSTANNNTVNLGGGTVKGNTITSATLGVTIDGGVYGGYSVSGTTQNNTVNLFGTADVSATGLLGGNLQYNGNTLNIGYNNTPWTGGDQLVKNISNFEAMDFSVVPWSKSKSAVTITDGTASDLSNTTVSANKVTFTGVKVVAKDDTMTLLDQTTVTNKATKVNEDSDFTIGIAVEGTGKVALDEKGNVVYNVKDVRATEQTHNVLMGAEATMTVLNVGNDYIGAATDGLALPVNTGTDGVASFAKLGGGKLTQETGSHIDVSTWNAILAVGHKNVKKQSSFEYGAFFEYGNGNYTTFNDATQPGDGSTRYTGGGLLAKWYTPKGLYVEGSLRAGTVHEDAHNLLRDNMNNAYSYNTDTNYFGFHVGVGRELKLDKNSSLDVYAKYFYNRRNGTDFTVAGADYSLDAVTSSLVRIGTRYTERNDRWNFYGGLAYEYEMDGKATGRVNGLSIRGADIGGGRVRGEIGTFMRPSADNPWGVDLNLTCFVGKKQGVMGSVSVAYTF
ncbi:Large exoproteins involved in heme utilization or adhesion [Anaerovibrio sp. JC8]|nr:Large exoproteins involved in heme utilization or adhesion [Anaerovibrio sp. JC8]